MKVTGALIALNLIGYAWEILIGGPGMLSPTGGGNIDRVMQEGSLYPAAVLQNGEWWRIFTGAFSMTCTFAPGRSPTCPR